MITILKNTGKRAFCLLLALAVAAGLIMLLGACFEGLKIVLHLVLCQCLLDAFVAVQGW